MRGFSTGCTAVALALGAATSVDGAIVAHWSFDTGSLTTDGGGNITGVAEATGNHNAVPGLGGSGAQPVSTAFPAATSSVTGQFGQALRFAGNNYLQFPNLTELMQSANPAGYTVSMWVQWPAATAAPGGGQGFSTLSDWGSGPAGVSGSTSRFTFAFGPNGPTSIRSQARHATGASGTDIYGRNTTTATVNNGAWHMLTWSFNTTSGALNVYFDGAFVETFNSTATSLVMANSTSSIAQMGFKGDTTTTPVFLPADVRLDEVWVFNETLSAGDVQSMFTTNTVPEPTCVTLLALGGLTLLRRRGLG